MTDPHHKELIDFIRLKSHNRVLHGDDIPKHLRTYLRTLELCCDIQYDPDKGWRHNPRVTRLE